jgi:hypothetical protein
MRVIRVTIVLALVSATIGVHSQQPAASHVRVEKVVQYSSNGSRPRYFVSLAYSFPVAGNVRISGLGLMPSQGETAYFTSSEQIVFDYGDGREVVTVVPDKVAAGSEEAIPRIEDFRSGPSHQRTWPAQVPLFPSIRPILEKWFAAGYDIEIDSGINECISSFVDLSDMPQNFRGKASILISYPFNENTKEFELQIKVLTLESHIHTSEWRASSPAVADKGTELLNRFLADFDKVAAK